MGDASYLLYALARRSPMILLVIVGIVFAQLRWNRHPKVSLLTVLGLALYLVESTVYMFLVYLLSELPTGLIRTNDVLYIVLYVLDDIAYALVFLLLVAAAFAQRGSQSTKNSKQTLGAHQESKAINPKQSANTRSFSSLP